MPDSECDIGALLYGINERIGDSQLHGQFGVLQIKTIEELHDVKMAQRDRCIDPHQATNVTSFTADFFIRGVQQLQNFPDLKVITLTRIGQLYRASTSIQKLLPYLTLKCRNET